jgi:hypothetical protein
LKTFARFWKERLHVSSLTWKKRLRQKKAVCPSQEMSGTRPIRRACALSAKDKKTHHLADLYRLRWATGPSCDNEQGKAHELEFLTHGPTAEDLFGRSEPKGLAARHPSMRWNSHIFILELDARQRKDTFRGQLSFILDNGTDDTSETFTAVPI